jgi:hypothetical protein
LILRDCGVHGGRRRDITTLVGNHTFRATGITAYLKNGGTLEKADFDLTYVVAERSRLG